MELLDINDPHPKKNRRWFLRLSLVGAGGVAAGAWWGWHRGAIHPGRGEAFAAWDQWQAGEDPKLRMVAAAVLAPSKHNTQPWDFRVEKGHINVFIDPLRTVGALDPLHRQAYFSTGCCLTNMFLAAETEGLTTQTDFLPDREFLWNWVARVNLEPGEKKKPGELYAAIPNRHTNRGPYDMARSVTPAILEDLARTGSPEGCIRTVWLDKEQQKAFAALTLEATQAIFADDQGVDAAPWYRTSPESIATEADGMTIDAMVFPPRELLVKKVFSTPTVSELDAQWMTVTRASVASMPAVGILTATDGQEPLNAIAAGVAWQRMALRATSLGLVMQPLTQTMERADREIATAAEPRFGNALREIVKGDGDALFAFRVGYPTIPSVTSPRRNVEQVVFTEKKRPKKEYTFRL